MTIQPPGLPLAAPVSGRVDHHESQRHAERGIMELLAHPHQWYPARTYPPLDFMPDQLDSSQTEISFRSARQKFR